MHPSPIRRSFKRRETKLVRGREHVPEYLGVLPENQDDDFGIAFTPTGQIVTTDPAMDDEGSEPVAVGTSQKNPLEVAGDTAPDGETLPISTTTAVAFAPSPVDTNGGSTTGLSAIIAAPPISSDISSTVPTSSSAIDTTLAPPSSSSFIATDTSRDPSTSTSPTSRIESASGAPQSTSTYVGIAFASIAGLGFLIAILAWWLRVRSRSRRRSLERTVSWPWDNDGLDKQQQTRNLEGGLGIHTDDGGGRLKHWDPTLMTEKQYDIDGPLPDSHAFPLPPPPAHTHMQMHGGHPTQFVTIPLHDPGQSVPDLMQDMGRLQITNLMPGDMSSGDMSRASTALGQAHMYPSEYGTPFQPHRPCFLSVPDGGLDLPWAPLRTRKNKGADGLDQPRLPEAHINNTLDGPLPLPYPGEGPTLSESALESQTKQEPGAGWAASIRSNIYNAFSAVVGGGNTPQAPNSSNEIPLPVEDMFTRPPTRHVSQRIRTANSSRGPRRNSSSSSTNPSNGNARGWTLKETYAQPNVVGSRTNSDQLSELDQDPFGDDAHVAANPLTDSAEEDPPPRVGLLPPRLPSIRNISDSPNPGGPFAHQSPSSRADEDLVPRRQQLTLTSRIQSRSQLQRPTLSARTSSSQTSATSVGSDMSRTASSASASTDEEHLTDGERYAKRVFQERRRRMKAMTVGLGRTRSKTKTRKTGRSRATMGSRRRSKRRTEEDGERGGRELEL